MGNGPASAFATSHVRRSLAYIYLWQRAVDCVCAESEAREGGEAQDCAGHLQGGAGGVHAATVPDPAKPAVS